MIQVNQNDLNTSAKVVDNANPKTTMRMQWLLNQDTKPDSFEQPNQKVNQKKKFGIKLALLAGIGLAAGLIYKLKNGKASSISVDDFKKAGNKFVNGMAFSKDGSKFTGSISHVGKKGDKYLIEYADGLLAASSKNIETSGKVLSPDNFTKYYPCNKGLNGENLGKKVYRAICEAGENKGQKGSFCQDIGKWIWKNTTNS